MKTVCGENQCTGCMACVEGCPKNAISIRDNLISYNAEIDLDKCIGCNLCYKICQQRNLIDLKAPISWQQGWAMENSIRVQGSSGGVAGALSKKFIEDGGVVYSCVFRSGKFGFRVAHDIEDLKIFSGSKYVKSDPSGVYKEIRDTLKNGEKVLFIGLPCQVAALKMYLGNMDTSMLYTVDLICHGTPSPKLLELFLNQYGYCLTGLENITFRNKETFQIGDGYKGITTSGVSDHYMIAFLHSLSYTDNCYNCKFARKERISDITIGDSWGSELSGEEQRKGISLVLSITDKGEELLKESGLRLHPVDLNKAIANNHQLSRPSIKPKSHAVFWEGIKKGKKFNSLVARCLPYVCLKQSIKLILIEMKLIRGAELRNCNSISRK